MSIKIGKSLAALAEQNVVEIAYGPPTRSVVHTPAAAAQATASVAARADSGIHVCAGVQATIACGGTAQTPITISLRDGATGAGNVLAAWVVAAPINQSAGIFLTDLCIPGSANTAMTLEFSGAGVAASLEAVTLTYFDITP